MKNFPEYIPINLLEKFISGFENTEIYFLSKQLGKISVTGQECLKYMNYRYILYQLNLPLQETNNREIFYIVFNMVKRRGFLEMDITEGTLTQNHINKYCKDLNDLKLHLEYWGFVRDLLEIEATERTIIYDPVTLKETVLTASTMNDFKKTFFYLIICEKSSTMKAVMKEMKRRKICNVENFYYGIDTGGMSTSMVIKLLIELSHIRNFHIFVLHDYDLSGLGIFFNIRQWFNAESVGVNPEFLDFCNINYENVKEKYRTTPKLIQSVSTVLKNCNLPNIERKKYELWIKGCLTHRIELNIISGENLQSDLIESKVKDFCDYLIHQLEDPNRLWNLTRFDKPYVHLPDKYNINFIEPKIVEDIRLEASENTWNVNKKIQECIDFLKEKQIELESNYIKDLDDFLEQHDFNHGFKWSSLIQDYEKMKYTSELLHRISQIQSKTKHRKIVHKNVRYKGKYAIRKPSQVISEQNHYLYAFKRDLNEFLEKRADRQKKVCNRLIKKTPEYKKIEDDLINFKDKYENQDLGSIFTEVRSELDDLLDEIEEDLNND